MGRKEVGDGFLVLARAESEARGWLMGKGWDRAGRAAVGARGWPPGLQGSC